MFVNRRPHHPNQRGRDLAVADRRARMMELRRDGKTYREIAAIEGCSIKTAHDHVQAGLREVREAMAEDVDAIRDLETQRMDEMLNSLGPGIRSGDPQSIMAAIRLMERRAKMLGLDAPKVVEVTHRLVTAEDVAKMDERDILKELRGLLEAVRTAIPETRFESHDIIDAEFKATDAVLGLPPAPPDTVQ